MIFARRFDAILAHSPLHRALGLFSVIVLAAGLTACQSDEDRAAGDEAADETARTVVDMTAVDYAYRNAPDSIPSGWTTFRMHNDGKKTHVFELMGLPTGVTPEDHRKGVATYRELLQNLRAGEIDTVEVEKRLPRWMDSDSLEYEGGLGYLAPVRTASITVRLEPGTYAMPCFVKTPEGRTHSELGMDHAFTVTADSTGADPPEADLDLRLSGYEIHSEGTLRAGKQTVAVHFGERQGSMEAPFQGLHLARLSDGVSADSVAAWANVYQAPAPTDFLGGAIAMDAGRTAYLTVDVSPGRYAWVSHASTEKGMMKTVTVE